MAKTKAVAELPTAKDVKAKLAELEARQTEEREQLFKGLLAPLYAEKDKYVKQRDTAEQKIYDLDKEIEKLTGKKQKRASSGSGGTRIRRSDEQLKADAQKMVDHLKKNPKTPGPELKKIAPLKAGYSPKKFIEEYAGAKVEEEKEGLTKFYSLK